MRILGKAVAAAAVLTIALAAPARADSWSFGFSNGGVSFSYDSGGYCDTFGCPYGYWDMPIYDCPVYWGGEWYRGPIYYRRYRGRVMYWLHGDWRYDEWRGVRPGWVCADRYRPALGFDFYERNGFRIRDDWGRRWYREHGRDWDRRDYRWDRRDDRRDNRWDRRDDRRDDRWDRQDDRRDDRWDRRDDRRDGNWNNGGPNNWQGNRGPQNNPPPNNGQPKNWQGYRGGDLPGMRPPQGTPPQSNPPQPNQPSPPSGPGGNPHARGNWMATHPAPQPAMQPPPPRPQAAPAPGPQQQPDNGPRGGGRRDGDHVRPNNN